MTRPDENISPLWVRRWTEQRRGQSRLSHYVMAAGAMLIFGAGLRLLDLGTAPYSHDEAIHANFSLALGAYRYDPVYHGPLLYHLTAFVFWAAGAHDFSARLAPALMSVVLLALILGPARRWLGTRGALWSAALLAISPVTVAYSRRLLHDAPVLALSLGAVLCFQAARETESHTPAGRRARIGVAALLSLLVATKANAFFIMAMLAALWLANALRRAPRPGRSATSPKPSVASWPWWVPLAALFAVGTASVVAVREPPAVRQGNERMLTIVCLLALTAMWEWLRRAPENLRPKAWPTLMDAGSTGGAAPAEALDAAQMKVAAEETAVKTLLNAGPPPSWDWKTALLSFVVAALLFAFFYGRGVLWWRDPLHVAALHGGDIVGSESAVPRMLRYWGGQQGQPRLPGRHDYYIVLMLLYEAPIVLAALGGLLRASRRRTPFTDLLLWWALTAFSVYALANEKVPWLLVHIMLPLCLLAGCWLAALQLWLWPEIQTQRREAQHREAHELEVSHEPDAALRRGFIVVCGLGAVFLLRGVSATSFERAGDRHEPLFYAQTTETFRDALLDGLRETTDNTGGLWIYAGKEWPSVWYLCEGAPLRGRSPLWLGQSWNTPPHSTPRSAVQKSALRLALLPDEDGWKEKIMAGDVSLDEWRETQRLLRGWNLRRADFIIWPRASWSALRPDRFALFWLFRVAPYADEPNGGSALSQPGGFLSEWSSSPVIVATPPRTFHSPQQSLKR